MTIEWNRVTWYSKLAAVVLFVGTFVLAFWLGTAWEAAQLVVPAASSTPPASTGGRAGAHCGGFIRNAPTCATGYHCVLTPGRPDVGGTCVADAATSTATSSTSGSPMLPAWVGDMKVVDAQSNGSTIHLALHERFAIRFGSSQTWTLSFAPPGGITRVANSTTADGFQGVYEAAEAGTTTLSAMGRAICATGQLCPQYVLLDKVTFVVGP